MLIVLDISPKGKEKSGDSIKKKKKSSETEKHAQESWTLSWQ